MPRQLKVIASNVTPNAPFRVNWTTPVIIKPGNKIAMDKFVGVIPDITQNFVLEESTFVMYLDVNAVNYESVDVVIPGGRYDNIVLLLSAMTKAANDAYAGFVRDMLPFGFDSKYNWYRDAGLKVQFTSIDQKLFFQYATSAGNGEYPMTQRLNLSGAGAEVDENNFFISNTDNVFIQQIDSNEYLLKGGGVLARLEFRLPTIVQAVADEITTNIGFNSDFNTFNGITQTPTGDVVLTFQDANGAVSTPIPAAWIDSANVLTMDFYQFNGSFQIRIYDNEDNPNVSFFDSVRDGFGTALGPCLYFLNYKFVAQIFREAITNFLPKIKNTIDMTIDMPYDTPADPTTYKRTMALDFSAAGQLRAGLSVPNGILLCNPQSSSRGNYSGSNNINMALINNLFDIALEIIDIPLETYQADDTGFPGSRKNIVAYFRPELTQVGSNTYRFDVNIFDWLDIPITYDLNLTSCSFRLLNPANNADLLFSSCSFNLLINDKEY